MLQALQGIGHLQGQLCRLRPRVTYTCSDNQHILPSSEASRRAYLDLSPCHLPTTSHVRGKDGPSSPREQRRVGHHTGPTGATTPKSDEQLYTDFLIFHASVLAFLQEEGLGDVLSDCDIPVGETNVPVSTLERRYGSQRVDRPKRVWDFIV